MLIDNSLRLSRGEYWLLDNVRQYFDSLSMLPNCGVRKKPPPHGLEIEGLTETLLYLQDRGWIKFQRNCNNAVLNQTEIRLALEDLAPCEGYMYFLTEAGGAAWEAFTMPNWSRFLSHTAEYQDQECGVDDLDKPIYKHEVVVGTERREIEAFLYHFKAIARKESPFCETAQEGTILCVDESTITIQVLEPFNPTYWKQLSRGYEFTFTMKPCSENNPLDLEILLGTEQLRWTSVWRRGT